MQRYSEIDELEKVVAGKSLPGLRGAGLDCLAINRPASRRGFCSIIQFRQLLGKLLESETD